MNLNDYGPAFPVTDEEGTAHTGMALRDYFAAAPMSDAELETLRTSFQSKFPNEPPSIARIRFFRADTMLEVRQQWYAENKAPAPLPTAVTPPVTATFPEME